MHVVPARMHHALVVRREWQPGLFSHRKGVDVAPDGDERRRRIATTNARHHSSLRHASNAGGNGGERPLELLRRAFFLKRQLWIRVDGSP